MNALVSFVHDIKIPYREGINGGNVQRKEKLSNLFNDFLLTPPEFLCIFLSADIAVGPNIIEKSFRLLVPSIIKENFILCQQHHPP
jgi:hypothetical protein